MCVPLYEISINVITLTPLYVRLLNHKPWTFTLLNDNSVRVGIFDSIGNVLSSSSVKYTTKYPKPGHCEQDAAGSFVCLL